jgi:peptide/nickel transport system permease protein
MGILKEVEMAETVPLTKPDQQAVVRDPAGYLAESTRLTFGDYFRALVADRVALVALSFIVLVILGSIGADVVSPHDPYEQSIRMRNKPPGTAALQEGTLPHLLGTDALGRDSFSRLIYGSRISLTIGFATVLISGTLGVTLGLLAGFYRGGLEDIIMRVVDLQMSLPGLLLALFVLFVLGPGFQNLILVLVITRWMVYCRITRSMMLSLREQPYVEAARTLGCSDRRIILRHMLPNLVSPLMVLATLEIATMMLSLAALDFLGLGIQPPDSSWGLMLAQGREYITSAWWLVTFPGVAILLTALAFNVLATWVRAVTDPVNGWRWVERKTRRRPRVSGATAA